jgi:N-acylneuraminate cytidylyltransferase
MHVAGIIPARGGSKAIEKKNIVDFDGRPLIEYTIHQARTSDRLDGVHVSTDDEEIAAVSRSAGADVIERPDDIAGDRSPTEDALRHAVETLRDRGTDPDVIVLLQCTSPLRREGDIDGTVDLVVDGDYDSALTCCADHKFYWEVGEDGAEPINYDPQERQMRQELSERYQENGSVYVTDVDVLERTHCRLGGRIGIHEMPELLSFEIDTWEDHRLLEAIAETADFQRPDAA